VDRYIERVKPGVEVEAAREELERLLEMCGPSTSTPPPWLRAFDVDTEGFVELADGIVGAVKDNAVTTVLIRGGAHSSIRAARNERKRQRKAARRKPPRVYSSIGRREVEPRYRWR